MAKETRSKKPPALTSSTAVAAVLESAGYLADEGLATAVQLAAALQKPLLLEGEPGVGKTEIARALAAALGRDLIRLQCYEGIDAAQALYEWNYAKQLLAVRAQSEAAGVDDVFNERFLVERPLLKALRAGAGAVLLVDEIDRADAEFEAFLLEFLGDFQITVPELGVFRAEQPPIVVLTSNRTRDVHDALKRRCLYHWVEHPTFEREVQIVRMRVPHVTELLTRQVAAAVEKLRTLHLYKPPGVAETIDWAMALGRLGLTHLTEASVRATLGAVLKYREDVERVQQHGVTELVKQSFERSMLPA